MGKSLSTIAEKLFSPVGGLQDVENELINFPTKNTPATMTRQRIISEIYLSKHLQTAVIKTIDSNEKLAKATIDSNEKLAKATDQHAKAMRWLTGALIVVGAVHAVLAFRF